MSKEEHYEERKRLYNLFKTDCPQTIGETDKAFDNDNFIDWLVDNQNTKPLIEEIAELKAEVNNLTNANDEYFKVNKQLESELKASKSEANEAVEFAEWLNTRYCPHETEPDVWIRFINLKEKYSSKQLYEIFKRNNK